VPSASAADTAGFQPQRQLSFDKNPLHLARTAGTRAVLDMTMPTTFTIRPYRPTDLPAAEALDARVQPYRPEDQPEVEAMFVRAAAARRAGDRWVALEAVAGDPGPIEAGDVAELLHLRVASERRRHGIGTALCHTVIDWSGRHGFRSLVLNTTSPQAPALALYAALGFGQAGRSYLDKYELVWHQLALQPQAVRPPSVPQWPL
jgi:GNAT superfamily N-acetyltransferase